MLIYIHFSFSFDFPGLDKVDFKNYFANEFISMGRLFQGSTRALIGVCVY